ncbi:MAG: endonuclease/exonuclease/phosphatase family protein [Actinomycetota bacterium]
MTAWNSLDTLGALALAPMLLLCLTQWCRYDRSRLVAQLQALTPYVLVLAVPIAVIGALDDRLWLTAGAMVPLATLLALALPIVVRMDTPPESPTALVVGCANLLGGNSKPEEAAAALAGHDADVWVLVEVTPLLADAIHRAMGKPLLHRAEMLDPGTNGIAIWSRWPIVSGGVVDAPGRRTVDVVVEQREVSVRVIAVHPRPPTQVPHLWRDELAWLGDTAEGGAHPTVMVGDFNGARWHPSFRRLLHRGWVDAHEAAGHGWGASWPADRGWLPPPFVRIDHALVERGRAQTVRRTLATAKVTDFRVPGSDHTGFVAEFTVSQ